MNTYPGCAPPWRTRSRQRETSIDLVNDGEFDHSMGIRIELTTDPERFLEDPETGPGPGFA
jgi:hypothetical protein